MIPILSTIESFVINLETHPVDWDSKPDANRWSAKEIIGHLCDSAQINLQRFIRCTYEENFKLIYYQNEWVAVQRYQDLDIEEIIVLWKALNAQIQRLLDNYPVDRWQATCDNGRYEVSLNTVEFLAYDYVAHMQHHLKQIIP